MEGQSPSLRPTRKPAFGRRKSCGRRCKKRVNLRNSSKLDSLIFTLFFCALCAPDHARRDRPAALLGERARGGRRFSCGKNEREVAPQRDSCLFRRSETAMPDAQANTAAVRTAVPSVFAKQTEKEPEDRWESLLSHPKFRSFFIQTAAT